MHKNNALNRFDCGFLITVMRQVVKVFQNEIIKNAFEPARL